MGKTTWTKISDERPEIDEDVLVLNILEATGPDGRSVEVIKRLTKYVFFGDGYFWEDIISGVPYDVEDDEYWISLPQIPDHIRQEVLNNVSGRMPKIIEMRD